MGAGGDVTQGKAKAVSIGCRPLTQAAAGFIEGITEGAKKSIAATNAVLMIFRMYLRMPPPA